MSNDKWTYNAEILCQHFKFVEKNVGCSITRRFLPTLVTERISIPTPITVHLEHCHECQQDFKVLSELNLRTDQFYTLSQILIVSNNTNADCNINDEDLALFARMKFSPLLQNTLQQITTCQACRKKIYSLRAKALEDLSYQEASNESCKLEDYLLFDICFPFSRKPEEIAPQISNLMEHISICSHCLEKAQTFFVTISKIIDRENSGIQTTLSFKENVKSPLVSPLDYEDWPISVEVINNHKL